MRLYLEGGGRSRTVALRVIDESVTISELSRALGFGDIADLVIDGRVVAGDLRVIDAPLVDGSSVRPRDGVIREPEQWWIGVTGGPDAGVIHRVSTDEKIAIGRDPHNHLSIDNDSVSARHAEVSWAGGQPTISDLASRNGTWLGVKAVTGATPFDEGQPVRVGSSRLELRHVDESDKPLGATPEQSNGSGRVLMNRPPRPALPPASLPVTLPDPIEDRASPRLSLVAIFVPILFAIVLVSVTGQLRFALFALMSPLMAIGNYVAARRKVTSERKSDVATHASALERLDDDLTSAVAAERRRRSVLGPDLMELRRRVEVPSSRLWERRMDAEDALVVRVGWGTIPWAPTLTDKSPSFDEIADDVHQALAQHTEIAEIELLAELRSGVLGIHGDDARARAVSRALALQAAVNHGPSDIKIAVVTTPERRHEWAWLEWLPHCVSGEEHSPMVLTADGARSLCDSILEQIDDSTSSYKETVLLPRWLFIVDDVSAIHERASSVRRVLERSDIGIHGVVLAERIDQLPASTTQVLEVEAADGTTRLGRVDDRGAYGTGLVDAVSVRTATEIARAMARFEDPEMEVIGGDLPKSISIRDVLSAPDAEKIRTRWQRNAKHNELAAPLGIGPEGPFAVDMTLDGPHGLVAGTTGAGKSELLRTMVIGLAAEHSPDDVVFVLVDYKGGSAFDVCTSLPHVVGIVTDLDEHLSQRALRSLDAELHHRELLLRDAKAKDIVEYRNLGAPLGPLPRLMVIIDEFATLRSELPDFVSALVGIAQRGRSLGVHLILATQRPSGAVDANIRANTNLRIALRVQDGGDSRDVIDDVRAAELPRTLPGRAYVRRGEGDLTPVQSAYASGAVPTSGGPRLRLTEAGVPIADVHEPDDARGETNLSEYVHACVAAAEGYQTPRRPWTDPLPTEVNYEELSSVVSNGSLEETPVVLALGDDPDKQRRIPVGWDPAAGHMCGIGALGSGVTTLLRSTAVALGSADLGREVWVYACDHGAKGLQGIDRYPHVAPVLAGEDGPRHERLLTLLESTLNERVQAGALANSLPLIVVVIDGIAGFGERVGVDSGTPRGDLFARLVREGPAVGIVFAVGASSFSELPRVLRGSFRSRFALEQNDVGDYSHFGLRPKEVPAFVPGRAVLGEEKTLAQIFDWSKAIDVGESSNATPPPSIEPLPELLSAEGLAPASVGATLDIPVGIDNETRGVATLRARAGEHITVAGPAGSGRTSALRLIANQLRVGDPELALVAVADVGSSLFEAGVFDAMGTFEDLAKVLELALDDERRWVVIVDDAERIEDESGPLNKIARTAPPHITLIVAMRSSSARGSFGHWSRFVRSSGVGILLQPDNSTDGDVLSVRLPRKERLEQVPGRCYVVQGGAASAGHMAFIPLD